ncbi:MAG: hypothetical protein JWO12_556 [Frankiales bacterium]|nr:hypothetical protein [Frankiales bacterium]
MEQDMLEPVAQPVADTKLGVAKTAGIVLTGLVVGAIGVVAIQSSAGASPASSSQTGFGPPGLQQGQGALAGQGRPGFGGPGGVGGPPGAQQQAAAMAGTVTAVGATTLTVSVGGAPTTVPVDSSTVITRNGSPIALSGLKAGDGVTVTMANGVAAQVTVTGTST